MTNLQLKRLVDNVQFFFSWNWLETLSVYEGRVKSTEYWRRKGPCQTGHGEKSWTRL